MSRFVRIGNTARCTKYHNISGYNVFQVSNNLYYDTWYGPKFLYNNLYILLLIISLWKIYELGVVTGESKIKVIRSDIVNFLGKIQP